MCPCRLFWLYLPTVLGCGLCVTHTLWSGNRPTRITNFAHVPPWCGFSLQSCHFNLESKLLIPILVCLRDSPNVQMFTETCYDLLLEIPPLMPASLALEQKHAYHVQKALWSWMAQQQQSHDPLLACTAGLGGKSSGARGAHCTFDEVT